MFAPPLTKQPPKVKFEVFVKPRPQTSNIHPSPRQFEHHNANQNKYLNQRI